MALNIKNPKTLELARELARRRGESVTQAVTQALQETLERSKADKVEDLTARLMAIARDCAAHLNEASRVDHGELLYDDEGLPK